MSAEGKSDLTVENYTWGPLQLTDWLTDHDQPADDVRTLTGEHLRQWLTDLAQTRAEATVRTRYKGMRQFITWCLLEGELDKDPMANVRAPAVHDKVVPMLSPEQLRALIGDCANGILFTDLRDHALVLFLADTGCRASEAINLHTDQVELRDRSALVVGKGSRPRRVAFGAKTARALDRYMRARRRQSNASLPWLWLGSTGKGRFSRNGLQQALRRRGDRLGLHVHPHMFRHGFADAWLSAGGNETDLMELAGWRSRQMLTRYGAMRRSDRAREAHARLSPMDRL